MPRPLQRGKIRVELWTDGSGTTAAPGGWAFILRAIDLETGELLKETEGSGWELEATNNTMELTALLKGLETLTRKTTVHVFTDSEYVMKPFTEGWLKRWRRKDWRGVKNAQIWQVLLEVSAPHTLIFTHVKGHSGVELNERCDKLAGEARQLGLRMVPRPAAEEEFQQQAMALAGAT